MSLFFTFIEYRLVTLLYKIPIFVYFFTVNFQPWLDLGLVLVSLLFSSRCHYL